MYRGQRGVALIGAVMVVSLVAVVAAAMLSQQHYSMRRTGTLLHGEQAFKYALGAELWASVILARDAEDTKIDSLDEDWAIVLPPLPVEGGTVQGQIIDQQGRFNLNNLVKDDGEGNPEAIKQFTRLLELLELDEQLVNPLVDWLDRDEQTRYPAGAEDGEYLSKEPPYRAANGPAAGLSELRLVQGFTEEVFEALAPHITVLPTPTPINVNTATAAVLASLGEELELSDGEALVEERDGEPFESKADFLSKTALAGQKLFEVDMAVTSDYFLAAGHVQVGVGELWLSSLLYRQQEDVTLVWRQRTLPPV